MKKKPSAKIIKNAIDSYPGGICFSVPDGRVILVNEKMNRLVIPPCSEEQRAAMRERGFQLMEAGEKIA